MKITIEGTQEEVAAFGVKLDRILKREAKKKAMCKDQDYINLLIAGQFINAIKLHRERNNTGLKESKEVMDRLRFELSQKGLIPGLGNWTP